MAGCHHGDKGLLDHGLLADDGLADFIAQGGEHAGGLNDGKGR